MKNAFYAQSGGVTAVINASACGVIETARKNTDKIGKVYAGKNGIVGALNDELIDTSIFSADEVAALKYTPGGAFGSCRYKLKDFETNKDEYLKLIDTFKKYNIGYFFYNGGGDSQDTSNKIAQISQDLGYPIQAIGIPKTIDNDLPLTDNCPGFGSVAKYIATSITEAALDVRSMCKTGTKVFIMEVMGRHAGWIAASAALAKKENFPNPHIILFPEVNFNEAKFLSKIEMAIENDGYCTIVVSEGIKDTNDKFLAESGTKDAFGHSQLGGAAQVIANIIKQNLNLKCHYAICDYLQRSARHIASLVDVEQAYAMGEAAVNFALSGASGVMPIITRISNNPYKWQIEQANLSDVANVEKIVPRNFISADGMDVTKLGLEYLRPLIQGEAIPPFKDGLPDYISY